MVNLKRTTSLISLSTPTKLNKHIKPNSHEPQTTPYQSLLNLLNSSITLHPLKSSSSTHSPSTPLIVYWMRMRDLRLKDNRALSAASKIAKELQAHLVVIHIFSPSDYQSHHRSPRRIDFVLRNLIDLRHRLKSLHIPLYTITLQERKTIPEEVLKLLKQWSCAQLFANIEHEIDELRRDIRVIELCRAHQIQVNLFHDTCLVEPGKVLTKENKPYSVFSPWQKNWAKMIDQDLTNHVESASDCESNHESALKDLRLQPLFEKEIPESIPGFELEAEDSKKMNTYWKAGESAAQEMLDRFINDPLKSQTPQQSTLLKGSNKLKISPTSTIIQEYSTARNRPDLPGTSRLSAYLAAGVISPRACLRASMDVNIKGKPQARKLLVDQRDLGVGMWQSELGWRDFYQHVLTAWPRVSMAKAFNEKYEAMVWETDEENFKAWKFGQTGYPFIDACMRQLLDMGYMHNRGRMCVAMFLTKHCTLNGEQVLMDWRKGEQWFMENLVDGDLGSNNGGWQWSSSTGTDSQPYFRIFAPLAQSQKSDPQGTFIRQYVPELKSLSDKEIHDPFNLLSIEKFKKLGYPKPIVDHAVARKRALARYKTPGSAANE